MRMALLVGVVSRLLGHAPVCAAERFGITARLPGRRTEALSFLPSQLAAALAPPNAEIASRCHRSAPPRFWAECMPAVAKVASPKLT